MVPLEEAPSGQSAHLPLQTTPHPASATVVLDRVLGWYGERILPVDMATARRWGQLSAALGHDSADLLIAATALERGLTVVTRNVRHFEPTGVDVMMAFEGTQN